LDQTARASHKVHLDSAQTQSDQGLQNWIEMFANSFLQAIPPVKHSTVIQNIENQLRPEIYRDGTWVVDHKKIRVVAKKE
jgi:hypothetical protein